MLLQLLFSIVTQASELGTSRPQPRATAPQAHVAPAPTQDPIAACLANKKVLPNMAQSVHKRDTEVCNRALGQNFATDLDYRITKTPAGIEVLKTVEYVYKGKKENRAAVEARIDSLKRCIPAFYKRFGINLKLNFSSWSSPTPTSIEITDKIERNDDAHWGLLNQYDTKQTLEDNCHVVAHEVGHMLGLQDHYVDKDCPDHQRGPVDDIMRDPAHPRGRLYPAQVQKIIQPLCGKL